MMRFNKRLAAAAVFVMGTGAGVSSQVLAADADFVASANIQTAIALAKNNDLNFGDIVPGASADTVEVDTNSVRNCGAALTCLGTVQAAQFTVTGTTDATYALTLPPDANISSGANNMLVDQFSSSLGGSNQGTLTGGTDSFTIGAFLNVGANQAVGAYSGTFTVTVEYN